MRPASTQNVIFDAIIPRIMKLLGTIDLEILQIAAAAGNGTINEAMLERSSAKRLGVGRTLDALASLRDRGLLELDRQDGSFKMTPAARDILWTDKIPLWARILRLLEIRACTRSDVSVMLCMADADGHDEVGRTLGNLQRTGMIMMEPQVRGGRPEKVYEILSEGIDVLESKQGAGPDVFEMQIPLGKGTGPLAIVEEIEAMLQESGTLNQDERRTILQKLSGLRDSISEATNSTRKEKERK